MDRDPVILMTVRGPRGSGKTHLINKILDMLRQDSNYEGATHSSDGVSEWGSGPIHVVIREEDGETGLRNPRNEAVSAEYQAMVKL